MFRLIFYILMLAGFFFLIKSWIKQDKREKELKKAEERKAELAAEAAVVKLEKENKKVEETLEKEKEKLQTD